MREALADGRAAVADVADPAERLRRLARLHLGAPRPRPQPRDRLPGGAAAVDQVHGAVLLDAAARLPRPDPRRRSPTASATGVFRADIKPTAAAKMFFGALDEMATNWILSRRRYSLEADADAVVDLFLNGARAR